MRKVYFITHPEVIIDPDIPVPEWKLSEIGRKRMFQLLKNDWIQDIKSIYCSNEQKAIDGAGIIATHLGKSYKKLTDLGENDRSSTGYLKSDEFEKMANQFFSYPDQSIKGWEKAIDAQNRIIGIVDQIVDTDNSQGNIIIISHGGVGTLLLCYIANLNISRSNDQPGQGGGNYFCFDKKMKNLFHGWKSID